MIGSAPKFFSPSPIIQVKVECKGISYVVKIPKNEIFRVKEIFQDNEYSIISRRSHSGPMTVVDIGANVGLYAIYAKLIDPNSVIHCFEPSPNSLLLLRTNLGHLPGIYVHPIGLFNRQEEALLNIHRFNTGQNSIKFKDESYSDSVTIQLGDAAKEFDKLGLNHINVMKIDTEGCEVEILESLGHRLSRVDYILFEYHSENDRRQIDNLLREFYLFGSKADFLGKGVVKYINARLIKD